MLKYGQVRVDGIHPQAPNPIGLICCDPVPSIELFHPPITLRGYGVRRESLGPFTRTQPYPRRNTISELDAGVFKASRIATRLCGTAGVCPFQIAPSLKFSRRSCLARPRFCRVKYRWPCDDIDVRALGLRCLVSTGAEKSFVPRRCP